MMMTTTTRTRTDRRDGETQAISVANSDIEPTAGSMAATSPPPTAVTPSVNDLVRRISLVRVSDLVSRDTGQDIGSGMYRPLSVLAAAITTPPQTYSHTPIDYLRPVGSTYSRSVTEEDHAAAASSSAVPAGEPNDVPQQQPWQQQLADGDRSRNSGFSSGSRSNRRKQQLRFLLFARTLLNLLRQEEEEAEEAEDDQQRNNNRTSSSSSWTRRTARAAIRDCAERHQLGEPGFESLTDSVRERLREVVPPEQWSRAESRLLRDLRDRKRQRQLLRQRHQCRRKTGAGQPEPGRAPSREGTTDEGQEPDRVFECFDRV